MQIVNIDISDSGRIIIDDRVYYSVENAADGMIQNPDTHERAVLKKIDNQPELEAADDFECEVLAAEKGSRGFRNIIYPTVLKRKAGLSEMNEAFIFTEVPESVTDRSVHQLTKALKASGFSIYSRIMAAMNLAESLCVIQKYVGRNIVTIHPEEIYVNIDSGDVYIWIANWLRDVTAKSGTEEFGFSPEWYHRTDKTVTYSDLNYFAAYVFFRLLCNDDPFDGSETLMQFPLLTREAITSIHDGTYGFVLTDGRNNISEYIGYGLQKKWRALPRFIRVEFEKNFTVGLKSPEDRTDIAKWLKIIQKMRDSLVYVNSQFKFCDPDVSNKVLFMVVDDFKIPVWPKKAVYWYHVDIPLYESQNGIVAGVTVREGKYYLSNLSGNPWAVTLNSVTEWVEPEQSIQIIEGMVIKLGDSKSIKVQSGEIDTTPELVDVIVPDMNSIVNDNIISGDIIDGLPDDVHEAALIIDNCNGKEE